MKSGSCRESAYGIVLASAIAVARTNSGWTYDEPTVMWRMRRSGLTAHAIIEPRGESARLTWFLNGCQAGVRDFTDWTSAIEWTDRMQFQNWTIGWRTVQDVADAPPPTSGT